jgi:hypothetical protein
LETPIDPSQNLVVEKPSVEGTQNQLEDDKTSPLEFSLRKISLKIMEIP